MVGVRLRLAAVRAARDCLRRQAAGSQLRGAARVQKLVMALCFRQRHLKPLYGLGLLGVELGDLGVGDHDLREVGLTLLLLLEVSPMGFPLASIHFLQAHELVGGFPANERIGGDSTQPCNEV